MSDHRFLGHTGCEADFRRHEFGLGGREESELHAPARDQPGGKDQTADGQSHGRIAPMHRKARGTLDRAVAEPVDAALQTAPQTRPPARGLRALPVLRGKRVTQMRRQDDEALDQSRRQSHHHDQRNRHDDLADHTGNHEDGQECGLGRRCRGDDRHQHAHGRPLGRLHRRLALLVQGDGMLAHDDRVIDEDTQHQDQGPATKSR